MASNGSLPRTTVVIRPLCSATKLFCGSRVLTCSSMKQINEAPQMPGWPADQLCSHRARTLPCMPHLLRLRTFSPVSRALRHRALSATKLFRPQCYSTALMTCFVNGTSACTLRLSRAPG
eukprot:1708725-Pleurochrysis_carterae.AAC.1